MLNNALEVTFFFLFMNKYQCGECSGRFRESTSKQTFLKTKINLSNHWVILGRNTNPPGAA